MLPLAHFQPFSPANILNVLIILAILWPVSCLQFSFYPKFKREDRINFTFQGNSDIQYGVMQITPESRNLALVNMYNQVGRVLHVRPFKLWSKDRRILASFNTSFQLQIQHVNGGACGYGVACGEGIAFILTNNQDIPTDSHGQWLGIVNKSTNGSSGNHIVAVEFDTRKSYTEDLDDNHVSVDVNGLNTTAQYPLGRVGKDVFASIRYNGESKRLTAYVSKAEQTTYDYSKPLFSILIDLSSHLLEDVYVGFSGSTGELIQLNYIKYWNFSSSTNIEKGREKILKLILLVVSSCTTVLFIGVTACYLWYRRMTIENQQRSQVSINLASILKTSSKGPRKFRFKELKSATMNFDPKNRLGRGGFGMVYKGILRDSNEEIAVKRVSKDSHQGEREFTAEVTTISHLSHKNLVRLIGWCYERDDLLLVYEFMPNGSLDKHIFSSEISSATNIILSWERRHKIICGVASALNYLHDECRNPVLHRDVKPSNIMLDSNYDARLGDFGLARTIQHDDETCHVTTNVAGTPGYIAPECLLTGRASVKTDVYAFGVFAMEVSCGRRPGNNVRNLDNKCTNIIDWLWEFYGGERILDAVDPNLYGVFDKEQIECVLKLSLACCHPNPNERPSMRVALQVLSGEVPSPLLPIHKPTFVWPVVASSSASAPDYPESSSGGGRLTASMELTGR